MHISMCIYIYIHTAILEKIYPVFYLLQDGCTYVQWTGRPVLLRDRQGIPQPCLEDQGISGYIGDIDIPGDPNSQE